MLSRSIKVYVWALGLNWLEDYMEVDGSLRYNIPVYLNCPFP